MSESRMDFIEKFEDGIIENMTKLRKMYLDLEEELERLKSLASYEKLSKENTARVFQQTINHLETSQMYSIKYLCLIGEKSS